jgi:hypothetical protein
MTPKAKIQEVHDHRLWQIVLSNRGVPGGYQGGR